jgi:hypothetical protein
MNIGVASLSSAWPPVAPIQPTGAVTAQGDAAPASTNSKTSAATGTAASTPSTAQTLDRMLHNRIFQAEQARASRLAAGGSSAQAQRYAQVAGASDDPSMDTSVTLSHG